MINSWPDEFRPAHNEAGAIGKGLSDRNSKLLERVGVPVVDQGMMTVFHIGDRCKPKNSIDPLKIVCV
jgi:hypothetical protein